MSSPLSPEEKANYTRIIDGILAAADLQTVTRKKIRQGLEAAIDKDLTGQKTAIKSLIEERFDAISANATVAIPTPPPATTAERSIKRETNGYPASYDPDADAEADVDDDLGGDNEIEVSLSPAKKKQKRESPGEDADARLAAELQAQENRLSRGPKTRGAGAPKVTKKQSKVKAPKKKSKKRVRADDSDVDGEVEDEKPKRKAGGGFQKPFNLSYPLAEVVGETRMSRPQVVKKLWEYIKGNMLQDPTDKRQILCDEKMQAIFKQGRIDMFQMNKQLGNHLYPIEEGEEEEEAEKVEEEVVV
ncbi:hypothetical protein B0T19DRAFT_282264 [Cercophora scortea]|uniref:DM2 domain-containing protein n=1 Tax=Cercophora scortea TaxID=314031 RepID=A0AAE0I7P9_9PEZI|nr:hypothetical protein B0T19DRAFT_282264 [Cercophora scortea]